MIDAMAAVASLPAAEARRPHLEAMGYVLVPTGMPERLVLQRAATLVAPAVNLPVVTDRSWPGRKERPFRDRLLAHPDEAAAHGALKRELIGRHGDLGPCTAAKTAPIQEIMDRDADEAGAPARARLGGVARSGR